jgi:hypothetical protein
MFLGATFWQLKIPDRNFFGVMPMNPAVFKIGEGLPAPQFPEIPEGKPTTDQVAASNGAERKAL